MVTPFSSAQSGRLNARPRFRRRSAAGLNSRGIAQAPRSAARCRDRTFYYAAFERERTDRETASDLDAATLEDQHCAGWRGIQAIGRQAPHAGLFPVVFTESELSGKLRHQISSRQSVTVGVAATTTRDTADAFNTGGLTDLSGRGTAKTADRPLTATWTAIVGNRATNELERRAHAVKSTSALPTVKARRC
jgi:hypothetical protein